MNSQLNFVRCIRKADSHGRIFSAFLIDHISFRRIVFQQLCSLCIAEYRSRLDSISSLIRCKDAATYLRATAPSTFTSTPSSSATTCFDCSTTTITTSSSTPATATRLRKSLPTTSSTWSNWCKSCIRGVWRLHERPNSSNGLSGWPDCAQAWTGVC
jgi:hypothetical protein